MEKINGKPLTYPITINHVYVNQSPLGTGWEWCRSGRTLRQFYRKSSKMETLSRCRIAEITEKQNIKKGQIIGFLLETTVSRTACNNPKSALAGLEKW